MQVKVPRYYISNMSHHFRQISKCKYSIFTHIQDEGFFHPCSTWGTEEKSLFLDLSTAWCTQLPWLWPQLCTAKGVWRRKHGARGECRGEVQERSFSTQPGRNARKGRTGVGTWKQMQHEGLHRGDCATAGGWGRGQAPGGKWRAGQIAEARHQRASAWGKQGLLSLM